MATVHIISEEEMRALMVDLKRTFEQRRADLIVKNKDILALEDGYRIYHLTLHNWASRVGIKLPYDF